MSNLFVESFKPFLFNDTEMMIHNWNDKQLTVLRNVLQLVPIRLRSMLLRNIDHSFSYSDGLKLLAMAIHQGLRVDPLQSLFENVVH